MNRVIVFTGKNLNDVFYLPCVKCIMKSVDDVVVVLYPNMVSGTDTVVTKGDVIVCENGVWKVKKKK